MSGKVIHYLYVGRDNQLKVVVKQKTPATGTWTAVDLSGVNRVVLILGPKTIDSSIEGTFYTKDANGNLGMDLSEISGIEPGTYDGSVNAEINKLRLTLFDAVNTDGLEVGRTYRVVVKEQ